MKHLTQSVLLLFASVGVCDVVNTTDTMYDEWRVTITTDDFEGKHSAVLRSNIVSPNGKVIGTASLNGLVFSRGRFHSAILSLSIQGLDGTWPACDFEFTEYKIDNSESAYFPKRGYACPVLNVDATMIAKFKSGRVFRFSASGRTGIVSLDGFTKAWSHAVRFMK